MPLLTSESQPAKSDLTWPVQNTATQIHEQEISILCKTAYKLVYCQCICLGNWQLCCRTVAITQQGGCKWLTLLLFSTSRMLCLTVMPLHHTHSTHMQTYTQWHTTNPSCLQYVFHPPNPPPPNRTHTHTCTHTHTKIAIRTNLYILTLSTLWHHDSKLHLQRENQSWKICENKNLHSLPIFKLNYWHVT